jgi:hypothetical protein
MKVVFVYGQCIETVKHRPIVSAGLVPVSAILFMKRRLSLTADCIAEQITSRIDTDTDDCGTYPVAQ